MLNSLRVKHFPLLLVAITISTILGCKTIKQETVKPLSVGTFLTDTTGSKLVDGGQVDLENAKVWNIPLDQKPQWLLYTTLNGQAVLVATLEDGSAKAWVNNGGEPHPLELTFQSSGKHVTETKNAFLLNSAVVPPVTFVKNSKVHIEVPPKDMSPHSVHALLPKSGKTAYIRKDGALVIQGNGTNSELMVNALPDARILVDQNDKIALYAAPTNRYQHAVLGDDIESARLLVIETGTENKVVTTIELESPYVFEGLAPLWADIHESEGRELITTISHIDMGSYLAVYSEAGELLAKGPAIGTGNRWRHVISADTKSNSIGVVSMPHGPGDVERYEMKDTTLEIAQANWTQYTSHAMHSRNLGRGLGFHTPKGEFEMVLVNPTRDTIALHSMNPVEVIATAPVGGELISNIVGVVDAGGNTFLAVGSDSGIRIWQSAPNKIIPN
ncbi:hypothetical protein [Teredinibacter sp. KSP-S5-2]|uniref:hypothetical protein n=1 Tax=Teredinibacter sp. KSP-S5-2 TaxID=3034506 RepID=UPI0029349097|nr:hypothetical protein [Teredinibacter sp. KSP-S5-2]WNO11067.1 hypothetical protein P5V12_07765 [Teredinibacter sp. KSP-S5-2]